MQSQEHRYPELSDGSLSVDDNDKSRHSEVRFRPAADASHHSSGSENEMSSLSTPPASDGDRSMSPANSESSDDDDFDLTFLTEKRNILKRYCEALHATECYHASIAKNPPPDVSHAIWDEAREIMEELFDGTECKKTMSLPTIELRAPVAKRPRIDISNVTRIDASACKNGAGNIHATLTSTIEQQSNAFAFFDSKCMVKTFQHLSSLGSSSHDAENAAGGCTTSIEVRDRSNIECHPTLVIPSFVPRKFNEVCKGTSMEEALRFTDISQLVCQSISPFAIIHANRAFFTYSGLSPQDVIGKPIDAIILVKDVNDVINESKRVSDPDFATGMLGNKSCQVQFKPVASHCMSHLLVQIYSDDAAVFAKAAISAAKHANVLVGCVG
ncbi:hypothetical protein MHU86_17799 [Fragilaria crotonensis]|nr:hypothetical protein MHU86_17799 [Fragilaria crotonensis]